jgi:transcription factor SPN1
MELHEEEQETENIEISQSSSQIPPPQTDVKGLINSIFGEDSDEEDEKLAMNKYSFLEDEEGGRSEEEGDDLIYDSEEDYDSDIDHKRKRLLKASSKLMKIIDGPSKRKFVRKSLQSHEKRKNKETENKEKIKENKEKYKDKDKDKIKKHSKRSRTSGVTDEGKTIKTVNNEEDKAHSGDEYDSGEELVRTAEDDRFIDQSDELDEIVKEYDEDEQNFDDNRPNDGKKKSASGSNGAGSRTAKKETDPLSLTMEMMKRPKETAMSESEKAQIATDLMTRMDAACRLDEELYRRGEPAIHKLSLLPVVQRIVGIKPLQMTLLDYDLLGVLKDWIEPHDARTLPSLAVRTAVYHLLLQLPCQSEHLKRTAAGKQPIGATIVALRRHVAETSENKHLLRSLMEKWCRPVFGKSIDPRASTRDSTELKIAYIQRQREHVAQEDLRAKDSRESLVTNPKIDNNFLEPKDKLKDGNNRVRTPYSSGFLFTVQPEYKVETGGEPVITANITTVSRGTREDEQNDVRRKLMKVMKEGRKKSIKTTTRAITVTLTGRNKS